MHLKRTLAFALALCLMLALAPAASAVGDAADEAAGALYEMGLFQGTSVNADGTPVFDLDRAPTRAEAVTMLVRLLGGEGAALAGDWDMPFTDVPAWAEPYVGYAYSRGLAAGTGETAFGSGDSVTASQYLTFVLRALGYESGTDFEWDAAWELSDEIGLTSGEYGASTTSFTRGDVALISYAALGCEVKGGGMTLQDTLAGELVGYDFDDFGIYYLPDDNITDSLLTYYDTYMEAYLTSSEVPVYSYFFTREFFEEDGAAYPADAEEFYLDYLREDLVSEGIAANFNFSYDAYGNYSAQLTLDGVYYYVTVFVFDDLCGIHMFGCLEENAGKYDLGYLTSLVELY